MVRTVYTAKHEKRLYALVLVGNSARPVRFVGNGDGFRNIAELQEGVREHYGTATFVAPSDFQREIEDRQIHSTEMIALLEKQSGVYGWNLCISYVYGSARPISASWATLPGAVYIDVNEQESGYYTYVAVAGRLDQEIVEDYELEFVSGPATRADAGVDTNEPRTY